MTRTPCRIPLGGGGTDLPSYASRYGGFLVTAAVNRYVYIVLNRRFEDSIRVSYSKTEIVEHADELQHPIARESLRLLGIDRGLEIVSIADIPANTGMGSSSSFTVGLLNALHTFKGEHASPQQLAEEAYTIEVEVLKEPIGSQDQYIAAFGGIQCLEIGRDGRVQVHRLRLDDHVAKEFENSVLLFYTGIQRPSREVLEEQSQAVATARGETLEASHAIKAIGYEVKQALESGELDAFGRLLHRHWETKKRLSDRVSSSQIDHWYELALQNGAMGGKIMGAGGGGFFMFYCNGQDKGQLRRAMRSEGLKELRFMLEPEGSKVWLNPLG